MNFFVVSFLTFCTILVLVRMTKKTITNIQFTQTGNYNNGWGAIMTWKSNSKGPFTITSKSTSQKCSTGSITFSGCWLNFESAVNTSGENWRASGKVYNTTGEDITFTVSAPGCKGSITTIVSCIYSESNIKTLRGPVLAKDVVVGDSLLQLDGSFKIVKSVKRDLNSDFMYKSNDAIFTKWHPVRYPNESKYVVAYQHPSLLKVDLGAVEVFHFELENFTDDILFEFDDIIAESWNYLDHGVEVSRV